MYKYIYFFYLYILVLVTRNCSAHINGEAAQGNAQPGDKFSDECKRADLCRHDLVPMCGIDSCGEMRTFSDACDMHEFNCDNGKDYIQKPAHECWVTCKRGRSFKKPEHPQKCLSKDQKG